MEMNLLEFFLQLAMGSGMILLNLGIQVWAIYRVVLFFLRRDVPALDGPSPRREFRVLAVIMMFLFLGHILQFTTWALLFLVLGEFRDFATAFYHSTVNFTSLGYGDIVMQRYRLLGALEAANGVLMFGLTAGLVLSVLSRLFSGREALGELMGKRDQHP